MPPPLRPVTVLVTGMGGPASPAIHRGRTGRWSGSDQTTYPGDPGQVPRSAVRRHDSAPAGRCAPGGRDRSGTTGATPGRCPLPGWPGVRTDTVADRSSSPPASTARSASQRSAPTSGVPSTDAGVSMSTKTSSPWPSSSPPRRRICLSRPGVQGRPRRRVSWYTLRCARCPGTGRPAAMNAPGVTRAGSRRSGACLGTNIAPRQNRRHHVLRGVHSPVPHRQPEPAAAIAGATARPAGLVIRYYPARAHLPAPRHCLIATGPAPRVTGRSWASTWPAPKTARAGWRSRAAWSPAACPASPWSSATTSLRPALHGQELTACSRSHAAGGAGSPRRHRSPRRPAVIRRPPRRCRGRGRCSR